MKIRPLVCSTIVSTLGLLAGCAPGAHAPATAPPADDPLLLPFARILRAEDRRQMDGDLASALSDPRAEVRARAALAVARIAPADAGTLLEAALGDPDARVRREAALGLGLLADPAGLAALVEAARDGDPRVREDVAEALGRIRDVSSASALSALLADAEPMVRAKACLAAWRLPDPSFAIDPLIEASRSSDPMLAFAADYALARLGAAGSEPTASGAPVARLEDVARRRVRDRLLAVASSKVPEQRIQAARGLAAPENALETRTLGALLKDPEVAVQVAATRSLCFPFAPIDPWIRTALLSETAAVAQTAVEGLGRVASPLATDILVLSLAKDPRVFVRETAIAALGKANPELARS